MPTKVNLIDRRFGLLLVLSESGRDPHGAVMWSCRCDCGVISTVRSGSLLAGRTRSCGCGVITAASKPRKHGASRTVLYRRWRAMLARTGNPNNPEYQNYGGRGIAVCERWQKSFENFAADMGPTFEEHLEIERDDVNGPYSPENCTWATKREQSLNKRTNHRVEWAGRMQTVQEWGEELGIKPNTIITRLRRGWAVDRALEVANR